MTKHPATEYRCLTCYAKPGQPCRRPSGHNIPFGEVHASRKKMLDFGPTSRPIPAEATRKDERQLTLFQ